MQSDPRIAANLLVKPTKIHQVRGAMGGPAPLSSATRLRGWHGCRGCKQGAASRAPQAGLQAASRAPLAGIYLGGDDSSKRAIIPEVKPTTLCLLPIFRTFLGDFNLRKLPPEFYYMATCLHEYMFFFRKSSSRGIASSNV